MVMAPLRGCKPQVPPKAGTRKIGGGRKRKKGIIMEKKDNNIINSLKRLERVGDETSRVTQKLKNACTEVADMICKVVEKSGIIDVPGYYEGFCCYDLPAYLIDENRFAPRGEDIKDKKRHQVKLYVDCDQEWWLSYSHYDIALGKDSLNEYPDRSDALAFAWVVSKGLIDAVADWIEQEKSKSEKRTAMLEQAGGVE